MSEASAGFIKRKNSATPHFTCISGLTHTVTKYLIELFYIIEWLCFSTDFQVQLVSTHILLVNHMYSIWGSSGTFLAQILPKGHRGALRFLNQTPPPGILHLLFHIFAQHDRLKRLCRPRDECSGPALVRYQSLLISSGLFRTTPPIVRASVRVLKTISCVWLLPQERQWRVSVSINEGQWRAKTFCAGHMNWCHRMGITSRASRCAFAVMPLKGRYSSLVTAKCLS